MKRQEAKKLAVLAGALALLTVAPPIGAQGPEEVRTAFLQWAKESLHPVSNADLDASTKNLAPLERMIGDAKIVGLSEGIHAAAEPLIFRNRVFKHLVVHLGFNAIAIESGIVASRVLNDYVTQGRENSTPSSRSSKAPCAISVSKWMTRWRWPSRLRCE